MNSSFSLKYGRYGCIHHDIISLIQIAWLKELYRWDVGFSESFTFHELEEQNYSFSDNIITLIHFLNVKMCTHECTQTTVYKI